MRKLFFLLFACSLFAQEDDEPSYWDFHPIHAGGNAIAIGKVNVHPKQAPEQGTLVFNKANAFAYLLVPISKTSYFFPRIEWDTLTMDWDQNPRFRETHFHFVQFALTFYSIAVDKWRWIARADYNIDVKHIAHPQHYSLFSALLWGSHEIHRKWHYHIGALGYTGFEGQMVYPLVGLDYAPNKKWLLQAIFPITYSIEYAFNPQWKLSLKARPLKERFRTGPDEPQPRSVFSYSSIGSELNLRYEKFLRLEVELFVGYNFGGSFYIKDRRGHNSLYTHIDGAPYAGANLNWGF